MSILLASIIALSIVTFAFAVLDKVRARRGRRRVPERVLLGLALAGGSPGLVLAMLVARHKTRKKSFLGKLALIMLAQAALVALAVEAWSSW